MSNHPPLASLDVHSEAELEYLRHIIRQQYVDNQTHMQTGWRYHPNGNHRATLMMRAMEEIMQAEALYGRLFSTDLAAEAADDIEAGISFLERRYGGSR